MEPYPSNAKSVAQSARKSESQPAQPGPGEPGARKTLLTRLGAGAEIARGLFGELDAGRLHALTERYREEHGDGAWEHIINVLPKWRADSQLITGFQGDQAIELLPEVLKDAERFEIARAVWDEQYAGIHEYIDLGNIELTDHLESIVRRRIAAAISKPTEESGATEEIHSTLLWLCAADDGAKDDLVKKLELTELGKAIKPIRNGIRTMQADIAERADGWSGRVERRIRSGPNTFDIALHKTEPVKLSWHVNDETARALRTSTIGGAAPDGGQPGADGPPAPPRNAPAGDDAAARRERRPSWLKRLAEQMKLRKPSDGAATR